MRGGALRNRTTDRATVYDVERSAGRARPRGGARGPQRHHRRPRRAGRGLAAVTPRRRPRHPGPDAPDPRNGVQRIEAVVLTGGSAYGLDSAAGDMPGRKRARPGAWARPLARGPRRPGRRVSTRRGGDFAARPDAGTGLGGGEAAAATGSTRADGRGPGPPVVGGPSAGSYAEHGPGVGRHGRRPGRGQRGRLGGRSGDGRRRRNLGRYFQGRPDYPEPAVHEAARRRLAEAVATSPAPPLNTTLAVVATDAVLTRAQAQKFAGTAHDGIARAVRPVHLLNDGDTVFALATGERELPAEAGPLALNDILAAGADTVTRAIVRAVLQTAEGVTGPAGHLPSYRGCDGPDPAPTPVTRKLADAGPKAGTSLDVRFLGSRT
ncbi:hypothetical protein SVIOM74S_06836 [Streptomyces violarus]